MRSVQRFVLGAMLAGASVQAAEPPARVTGNPTVSQGIAILRTVDWSERERKQHGQCGHRCVHQSSIPRCAGTPALKWCLTNAISVTVSASSISSSGAPRPVSTTCTCDGRSRRQVRVV